MQTREQDAAVQGGCQRRVVAVHVTRSRSSADNWNPNKSPTASTITKDIPRSFASATQTKPPPVNANFSAINEGNSGDQDDDSNEIRLPSARHSVTHEDYKNATSLNRIKSWSASGPPYKETISSAPANATERVNAAFVVLARNGDLPGILESIKQMEDRFNKKYQYPYVFLNEEPFSDEFKKWTTEVVGSKTIYGQIPHDHWFQPDWIDEEKATKARLKMIEEKVIYGHSVPYRNMCRFNSGFFFRHELLKDYDYYWRIEPNVKFFCDLDYDPFKVMKDGKKVYGFTVSLYEYPATIPTLWDATKEFIKANPQYIPKDNAMGFLSDNNGETYNNCHFWSNFEIGDLNFWRGEAYMKYFEHLDSKGGFYYERWGDAPVHSIGAGLFAHKDQIHFFNDIGYKHEPFMHCPQGEAHARGKCWCDAKQNFDYEWYSCLKKYDALF